MLDITKFSDTLPAYAIAEQVNEVLKTSTSLVITAPPGAGKSTLLPLTMLETTDLQILVLEPRRLAARQIAERMASMLGEKVGMTVGCRMRFESKVSKETRIEVITEGILTRMLIDNPALEGVGIVIFDEFHERSLTSDVALTLVRESQQILRPDLRLVIMSATIDTEAICKALQAPLVESEGHMFPVNIVYGEDLDWNDRRQTLMNIARIILEAHRRHEGDILVFLPGESEILQVGQLLENALGGTHICPLYGMLSPERQHLAIAPSSDGERKVVLSTPIAETSLTIEGVRVVIDSGVCRRVIFNPRTALSSMHTVPVSKDMARQRAGRAGRVAEGICYRLWSRNAELRMDECRKPEILETDLTSTLLDIAAWGESDIESMPWLTMPPRQHIYQAADLLRMLGAIDEHNSITAYGRALSRIPCHPRIAAMLTHAEGDAGRRIASDIAAILEASSLPLKNSGSDITEYLDDLNRKRTGSWKQIARAADHYYCLCPKTTNNASHSLSVGALLAMAYPERIARRSPDKFCQYRLANGNTAITERSDTISAYEWIAIAHMNADSGRIFLAAPLNTNDLETHISERDNITWDNKNGCLIARRERRIGQILADSKPLHDLTQEQVVGVICEAARKYGTSMLDFSDNVLQLQRRVHQLAVWHPELNLPDLSTDVVLSHTTDWLPLFINRALTTDHLKKIDLTAALWTLLTYEQQTAVERLAPSHLTLPGGRRVRVEYREGAEQPIVRARLQDCFGMTDTPRLDDGRIPVLMELLSPGFKPVQLTSDLRSFWSRTYFEVRKELKRRYPKHTWPENPLS